MKIPAGMEECPQCDPCNPECDEQGMPYTCFACCDTGWIKAGSADDPIADERERRVFASSDLEFSDDWKLP